MSTPARWKRLIPLTLVIGVAVLPRLYRLTAPHLLDFHSWRQGDSAAFTRSYVENGLRLLSPTVDRQPCSAVAAPFGQVESEFPVHSFVTAVPLKILGLVDTPAWSLRLASVALFIGTCLYLYRLVRRLGGSEGQALGSLGVLSLSPLAVFFTRSPQPDGPCLMLSVALLHHLDVYLTEQRRSQLALAAAYLSALLLAKISNAFMLLPAVALVVERRGFVGALKSWPIHAAALLALLPVGAWYWHANGFAWTFEIWGDRGLSKWTHEKIFWAAGTWQMLSDRLAFEIIGWGGLVLALLGWASRDRGPALRLSLVWSFAIVVFVLATLPAQRRHIYYQLPLVLPVSIAAGYGLVELLQRRIWAKVALAGLVAIELAITWHALLGEKTGTFHPYFRDDAVAAEAVALLHAHAARERVVSVDRNPALFYNSRTQGYFEGNPTVARLLECARRGRARHILLDAQTEARLSKGADFENFTASMKKIASSQGFRLYRAAP